MTKKEQLINEIKNSKNKYFNEDQKIIAVEILKNAPEEEVQAYAHFIYGKRKTGFAFDYSPEIAQGKLITLREDKDKRINIDDKIDKDENKLIIGDNYNALKCLQITHKEKIDIIYIDPPYNTESMAKDGNSSWKENSSKILMYKNKFGRGGYLNMMMDRLTIAKDLLANDGVIFVAIDDAEQAYLKVLMDDIFGEENFIANMPIRSQPNGRKIRGVSRRHEYIITYRKSDSREALYEKNLKRKAVPFIRGGDNSQAIERPLRFFPILVNNLNKLEMISDIDYKSIYNKESKQFDEKKIIEINQKYSKNFLLIWPMNSHDERRVWQREFSRTKKEINQEIFFDIDKKNIYSTQDEFPLLSTWLESSEYSYSHHGARILNEIIPIKKDNILYFRYPKSVSSIKHLLKSLKFEKQNVIILDFFAGSGTTGQAVMELNREDGANRNFILCTNNENNIADNTTYERLHRIIKGKGTNGEDDFIWLETNKPYKNEKLRVINIHDSIKISVDENVDEKIYDDAKNGLKLLDSDYNKTKINLYYDLAALNPLENDDDKF